MNQATFDRLADEFEYQTAASSVSRQARKAPAYNELIRAGTSIVPRILERLATSQARPHWFYLLAQLTGADPARGARTLVGAGFVSFNVDETAGIWRSWGREQGYEFV